MALAKFKIAKNQYNKMAKFSGELWLLEEKGGCGCSCFCLSSSSSSFSFCSFKRKVFKYSSSSSISGVSLEVSVVGDVITVVVFVVVLSMFWFSCSCCCFLASRFAWTRLSNASNSSRSISNPFRLNAFSLSEIECFVVWWSFRGSWFYMSQTECVVTANEDDNTRQTKKNENIKQWIDDQFMKIWPHTFVLGIRVSRF